MINFFWIVLIAIVATLFSTALVVAGLYLFWDSIYSFILKRRVPKDKIKLKDGGKLISNSEKEVQQDGQYRDYERLREEGFRASATRERATETENTLPGQFTAESRDAKIDSIASEHAKRDIKPVESW